MRKVYGLIIVFIIFYVPALKPRLNSTEPSLRLSENITLFAVHSIYIGVISRDLDRHQVVEGVSLIYILYNVGERTEPCGTPARKFVGVDISPSIETQNFI
jgi:hypothetical protein